MALAEVFEAIAGPDAPVEFQAYDGSVAGTPGSPVKVTVRSPIAVSYLAQAPGALGLARAYVSGHRSVVSLEFNRSIRARYRLEYLSQRHGAIPFTFISASGSPFSARARICRRG